MGEQLEVLKEVVTRLDAIGVPYMLTGSVAMNFYAVPRMTRDIDLVVELKKKHVLALERAFRDHYYVDLDTMGEAARDRGMFNLIHLSSMVKIDLVVRKSGRFREVEFARRGRLEIEGFAVWVATAEDLLLSKLCWARDGESELQRRDARNLALSVEELDVDYLREWSRELGIAELLEETLS